MVRIYQQAEESQIKRLENELGLGEIYLLGVRNDNNHVIFLGSSKEPSGNYRVFKDMSIIEDDSGPIYLSSRAKICEKRCKEGEDNVIERLEKDLNLQGIYVFGIDKNKDVVIVHRGQITKNVYIRIFGYGPDIKIFDLLGRFLASVNICG